VLVTPGKRLYMHVVTTEKSFELCEIDPCLHVSVRKRLNVCAAIIGSDLSATNHSVNWLLPESTVKKKLLRIQLMYSYTLLAFDVYVQYLWYKCWITRKGANP